jgi:hypothetical protein
MRWFGKKKTPLWITDAQGNRHLTEAGVRQFDQWAAEGKIERVDCQVHILDPMEERERVETWFIGDEAGRVSREIYNRLKDDHGHLYALIYYKDGEPECSIIAKLYWDQAKLLSFS